MAFKAKRTTWLKTLSGKKHGMFKGRKTAEGQGENSVGAWAREN